VSVSEIARRHGVTAPIIFRWRAEFGFAEPKERPLLVTARVVERPQRGRPKSIALFVLHDLMVPPPNAITVELLMLDVCSHRPVRRYVATREATP
jgi:transposase-like protein